MTSICFYEYIGTDLTLMGCLDCQVTGQQIKCGNGAIAAAGYSNYDLIIWSTGWCFNPILLPIVLEDFRFENNLFIWSTLSELNNDYFTIEKSYDNSTWEKILQVSSLHHTTDYLSEYRATYELKEMTSVYFRLSQTDFDGTVNYFDPIHVLIESTEISTVYPNPSEDKIFYLNTSSKLEKYELYDINGVLIEQADSKENKLDFQHLKSGLYFVHLIQTNGEAFIQKIVF